MEDDAERRLRTTDLTYVIYTVYTQEMRIVASVHGAVLTLCFIHVYIVLSIFENSLSTMFDFGQHLLLINL